MPVSVRIKLPNQQNICQEDIDALVRFVFGYATVQHLDRHYVEVPQDWYATSYSGHERGPIVLWRCACDTGIQAGHRGFAPILQRTFEANICAGSGEASVRPLPTRGEISSQPLPVPAEPAWNARSISSAPTSSGRSACLAAQPCSSSIGATSKCRLVGERSDANEGGGLERRVRR